MDCKIWISAALAGLSLLSGLAQARPEVVEVVTPMAVVAPHHHGHAVFIGYDEFGRPVYAEAAPARQIVGFDRAGRPVFGYVYNNRPVFIQQSDFALVVRPYALDWTWSRHHDWDRRHHPEWERHEAMERGVEHRDFGHDRRDFGHDHRDFGHDHRDFGHDHRDFGHEHERH